MNTVIADAAARTVQGACPHDCPDTCALKITVEHGRVTKVAGDPAHEDFETALAKLPPITVPSIDLHGEADGVNPPPKKPSPRFTGRFERRLLPGVGHNPPQEAPQEFARALLSLTEVGEVSR